MSAVSPQPARGTKALSETEWRVAPSQARGTGHIPWNQGPSTKARVNDAPMPAESISRSDSAMMELSQIDASIKYHVDDSLLAGITCNAFNRVTIFLERGELDQGHVLQT